MPAFINSHVTKFRFSGVPVCEGATEHGSEKPQWKQQLSNAGLQGQVLTCWLLFSMSLMHQTLCLGNTDSCSASMFDRERVRNTSRATLNKHLNTSCVWCRKQLTLSRVAGSRIQSSQSPAPSITKVPLSSPVLGYDHSNSEENEITSAEPFPFHKSTARAVGCFTHAHSHSTVECNPAMPWWAVPASASPGGEQWVLLLKWQPLATLTIPHFLDRTSTWPLPLNSDPKAQELYHILSASQQDQYTTHRYSGNTYLQQTPASNGTKKQPQHPRQTPQPCVVFISSPSNRTARCITNTGIQLLDSSWVSLFRSLSCTPCGRMQWEEQGGLTQFT